MVQRNKTDQFFREKLDQIEFQPTEQAWDKVLGSISSKPVTPWKTYLSIAAGIALVLTLGIWFYPGETTEIYSNDEVIAPQPLELTTIDIWEPENEVANLQHQKTRGGTISNGNKVNTPVQPDSEIKENDNQKYKRIPLELVTIEEVQLADADIAVKTPQLKSDVKESSVKITYYTARSSVENEPEEGIVADDSLKTNFIDKMRFFARNVSPVELITDLRSAKEELIQNGLRKD